MTRWTLHVAQHVGPKPLEGLLRNLTLILSSQCWVCTGMKLASRKPNGKYTQTASPKEITPLG